MHGIPYCHQSKQLRIKKHYFATEGKVSGQEPNFPGEHRQFQNHPRNSRMNSTHEVKLYKDIKLQQLYIVYLNLFLSQITEVKT